MTTEVLDLPRNATESVNAAETTSAYWSGVFAMTLCVFALIASEFMPVSLLSSIAADLRVTDGMTGQGIAISGAFAVITSLFISSLAGAVNRKTLLLVLTTLMAISGAIVGLAQNYTIYMAGRALIGVVVGGFWSMSTATAMRLVPASQVPRALAIFNSGNALATVVAAPLGSYLGAVVGWRSAFLCLVPVALIAFAWQWISLPAMPARQRSGGSLNIFTLFRSRVVRLGMLGVGIFFMGQFTLFTYVRPFLENVTQAQAPAVTLALLVIGIAGFIGTTVIGTVLKWQFYTTLIAIPLLMAATALALIVFGGTVATAISLLGLWGFISTAAPVGWWSWIARTLPQDAEAAGGLMVAIIQLSIALGSTLGGVLLDHGGYHSTFFASAGLLLLAALLIYQTSRSDTV